MRLRTKLCVGVAVLTTACGSGGPTSAPAALLSVGGDYSIQKSVVSDACGGQPATVTNPGSVSQAPGSTAFVLNDHRTRDLPGSVSTDGTFTLQPYTGAAGGVSGRDTFANGRFTASGLSVRVTTTLLRSQGTPAAPDCAIVADWQAAKQGAPNVIP